MFMTIVSVVVVIVFNALYNKYNLLLTNFFVSYSEERCFSGPATWILLKMANGKNVEPLDKKRILELSLQFVLGHYHPPTINNCSLNLVVGSITLSGFHSLVFGSVPTLLQKKKIEIK